MIALGMLLEFTAKMGDVVHQLAHAPVAVNGCSFNPSGHVPRLHVDQARFAEWNPAPAIKAWAVDYDRALASTHDTLIIRAKERLSRDLGEPVRVRTLARILGCSTHVLQRRFVASTGETLTGYRRRARAAAGIEMLRRTIQAGKESG